MFDNSLIKNSSPKFVLFIILLACSGTVTAQTQQEHRTGAIILPPEEYAKLPKYVIPPARLAAVLPESVDNSAGLPPIRNQGEQGSCTAWAVGYYCKTYQEGKEHGWDLISPSHQFSPAFLYNHLNWGKDEGSGIWDAMNFIAEHGCATLDEMPYNAGDFTSWPSANIYKNALTYRADSCYSIVKEYIGDKWVFTDNSIDIMKQIIAGGNIFVISIMVDSIFDNLDSLNDVQDVPGGTERGGHALAVVGYDNAKGVSGAFKIANSWGTWWGNKGFAWLTYNFIKNYSSAYIMLDRTGYSPSAYARVNVSHPHRGDLDGVICAMDNNKNIGTFNFFRNFGGDFPGFDFWVDISDLTEFLPPDNNHKLTLSFMDKGNDSYSPSLVNFFIEYNSSVYSPVPVSSSGKSYGITQWSFEGESITYSPLVHERLAGQISRDYSPYLAYLESYLIYLEDTLSIEAGSTIQFDFNSSINVFGSLYAQGTETDSIYFISANENPAPGDWKGISFWGWHPELPLGFIDMKYCVVRYADEGILSWAADTSNYFINIERCTISECSMISILRSKINLISNKIFIPIDIGTAASAVIKNNIFIFQSNFGVVLSQCFSASIENNTIVGNDDLSGTGIWLENADNVTIRNNIIVDFYGGIYNSGSKAPTLSYNNLWNNLTNYDGLSKGVYDISIDPKFVNQSSGDFHLVPGSPCIDAGDPSSDYSNEPLPNGGRINLGAYGNTSEATPSYPPEIVLNVDQISFDSVFVDSTKGQYFKLYNLGVVDLKVTEIYAIDKQTFLVTPDSATISPGDSQEVYIAFSPKKEMLYIDTLTILNNDHTVKLVVTGKGVPFRAFPLYTGNLFTRDTTGYYDLWATVNALIENPVVKVIVSKNSGVSFGDTLSCVLDQGKYRALCPACPLETTLKFYYELIDLSGRIYRLPPDAPSTTFTLNVCSYREGDLNGDWKVNVFDLLEFLKRLKNPDTQNNLCDINGDKKIDIFDLLALLKLMSAN